MKRDAAFAKILCQETTQIGDQKEVRVLYESNSMLYVDVFKEGPGRRVMVSRAATMSDHARATQIRIEQQEARRVH